MSTTKIASPNEMLTALRQVLAYCESKNPSREVIASNLQDLARRVVGADDAELLEKQKKHAAHPPRMREEGGFFVVDVFSPIRGGQYIMVAEWRKKEDAVRDLATWKDAWEEEKENFKKALG